MPRRHTSSPSGTPSSGLGVDGAGATRTDDRDGVGTCANCATGALVNSGVERCEAEPVTEVPDDEQANTGPLQRGHVHARSNA